eukprot:scaffold188655_cov35-Tisochrysis_lutea.AAC.3
MALSSKVSALTLECPLWGRRKGHSRGAGCTLGWPPESETHFFPPASPQNTARIRNTRRLSYPSDWVRPTPALGVQTVRTLCSTKWLALYMSSSSSAAYALPSRVGFFTNGQIAAAARQSIPFLRPPVQGALYGARRATSRQYAHRSRRAEV